MFQQSTLVSLCAFDSLKRTSSYELYMFEKQATVVSQTKLYQIILLQSSDHIGFSFLIGCNFFF